MRPTSKDSKGEPKPDARLPKRTHGRQNDEKAQ
jgi:hypothetical protein